MDGQVKWWALAALGLGALAASGCKEGCLSGDAKCEVPSPCPKVQLSCDASNAGALAVATVDSTAQRPKGWDADAAKGDVLLQNAFTQAVIAGIGNVRYLDPSGGSLIDLAVPGQASDGLNQVLQVTGILPGDAAHYTSLEVIDQRPALVAVQVKGTLDGHPDVKIATRYELRPCDRGVRVRTEILNASKDAQMWALADGWYWSLREAIPFTPGKGLGFEHPSFDLLTINDVYVDVPFMSASLHTGDQLNSYAEVSCTEPSLEGFHSETVSAVGLKRTVVPPRGNLVFERYIAMEADSSIAAATGLALDVRAQVLGEKSITVSGKLSRPVVPLPPSEREAVVQLSEGSQADPPEARAPWNQAVPDAQGHFSLRVPAGKTYVLEVDAFGHKQIEKDLGKLSADADVGELTLPQIARVKLDVRDQASQAGVEAEVFVVPADDVTKAAVEGSFSASSPSARRGWDRRRGARLPATGCWCRRAAPPPSCPRATSSSTPSAGPSRRSGCRT